MEKLSLGPLENNLFLLDMHVILDIFLSTQYVISHWLF